MKKINVIDVFIILFVVLTIVGIVVRVTANVYFNEKNNGEYVVSVKISSVDSAKENAIAENDEVYLGNSDEVFGVISGVAVQKYFPDSSNENSGAGMDIIKCDILCEITVRGIMSDQGFLLESGEYLYAGMSVEIKTAGYEGAGLVMGISDKNE